MDYKICHRHLIDWSGFNRKICSAHYKRERVSNLMPYIGRMCRFSGRSYPIQGRWVVFLGCSPRPSSSAIYYPSTHHIERSYADVAPIATIRYLLDLYSSYRKFLRFCFRILGGRVRVMDVVTAVRASGVSIGI